MHTFYKTTLVLGTYHTSSSRFTEEHVESYNSYKKCSILHLPRLGQSVSKSTFEWYLL